MAFLSGSSNLFAARLKCTVDLAKLIELFLEGSFGRQSFDSPLGGVASTEFVPLVVSGRVDDLSLWSRRALLSDARIIMGNDEDALVRLWREKRGEVEPEGLTGNLIVELGVATEALNRRWYEGGQHGTGHHASGT